MIVAAMIVKDYEHVCTLVRACLCACMHVCMNVQYNPSNGHIKWRKGPCNWPVLFDVIKPSVDLVMDWTNL